MNIKLALSRSSQKIFFLSLFFSLLVINSSFERIAIAS